MANTNDITFKLASPQMNIDFVEWLSKEELLKKEQVSSVYYPSWKEDYTNARSWNNNSIDSWEKYKCLLRSTMSYGFSPEVLLQGTCSTDIDSSMLKKYLDLGIRKFTVTNDAVAHKLKELDPDVFISASIIKVLSPEDIRNNDFSIYDEICLFFYYNVNLDAVKCLPDKYQYSICGNSGCKPNCRHCVNHWLSDEMYDCYYEDTKIDISMNYKEFMKYFSPYVKRIKILDRLNSTEELINNLYRFMNSKYIRDEDAFNKHMDFPKIYNKQLVNG